MLINEGKVTDLHWMIHLHAFIFLICQTEADILSFCHKKQRKP